MESLRRDGCSGDGGRRELFRRLLSTSLVLKLVSIHLIILFRVRAYTLLCAIFSAPSVASSSRSTVSEDAMPSVYVAFATVTVTDTETLTQTKTTTPSASSSANQASSERRSSSSVVPSIVFGSPTVARGGAEFKPTPFSGSVTSIGYSTASPVLAAVHSVHSVVPSLAIPPGAQSQQAVTGSAAASAASAASLASARNAAIASQRPLGSLTGTNGGHVQGVAPVQNDASSSKASSSSTAKASSQTAQATSGTLGSLTGTNGGLAPAPANDVNSVTTASSKSTAKSSSTSQSKTSTSSQPAATVTPGSSLGSLTGTNGGFAGNLSSPSPAGDNIVSDVIDSLGTTVGAVVSTKSSSSTQRPATTSAAIPKSSSTAIIKSSSSSTAKSSSTAPASTAVPQPAGDSQSQSQVLIGYWPDVSMAQCLVLNSLADPSAFSVDCWPASPGVDRLHQVRHCLLCVRSSHL